MDNPGVILAKLDEALDAERFRAWLEPRYNETVGRPVVEWACPISIYLNATVLGDALWANTDSDKVSIYSRDPAARVDHEALVAARYLPDWAEEFVRRIDMYGSVMVVGAHCLAALDAAVLLAGGDCDCEFCRDEEIT